MTDILSPARRSALMASIRGRDTKPELAVRRLLHGMGFRYRLHRRDLPGRPDIVLPRWHTAILVHGCLFHGHECRTFRWPATNAAFWRTKILRNRERDRLVEASLAVAGWRVLTVWECALRGSDRLSDDCMRRALGRFVTSGGSSATIAGSGTGNVAEAEAPGG